MPTKKYIFLEFALEVLSQVDTPMTFQEIWDWGVEHGIDKKLSSSGKTPWQTLGARLFVDIRDNPDSQIMKVGKNPARFFLISRKDELKPEDFQDSIKTLQTKPSKDFPFHERSLHSLLAYYAFTNTSFNRGRQIYTKTIFHERSKHNQLNEWVHPDLVGFYSPVEDWNETLLRFNNVTTKTAIRLYSFEMKKQIDRSNYRECYFQAVSNSSWANEGYLVACSIQQQDDLLSELERLSASFGIGIIRLDLDDIDSSNVLYPAREKDELDWETMNKLCDQNEDFATFIDDVQRDFSGRKIHPSEYEDILSDPEEYIKGIFTTKK